MKDTIQWLLVYSQTCATTTSVDVTTFSSPQKETHTLRPPHFPLSPHQPPENTHLLSVYRDLPVLDVAYKQRHTIRDLLCLAFKFTWQKTFEVPPCCSTCQYFIFMNE